MTEALSWCGYNQIDCLYLLAEADDVETVRLAEDNGFRCVDIRITLEKTPDAIDCGGPDKFPGKIRPFRVIDLPTLRDLAGASFHVTRFYFDLNFPREACDALYQVWIEKSCCQGYADAVLVAEWEGIVAGFITCKLASGSIGNIGLVGVGPNNKGMGVGTALVRAAMDWFAERSILTVNVVTQGRNTPAQRLYQRSGFITRSVQFWYHKWFI